MSQERHQQRHAAGKAAYLTVGLVFWALGAPHSVVHGDLLQEGEALQRGEERGFPLAEVEFHSAVVTQHVGVEGTTRQLALVDLEGHAQVPAVLGEGQLDFAPLKVLRHKAVSAPLYTGTR